MVIEEKYLNLINCLIHDKRTGKNGILCYLKISQLKSGFFLSYDAMFDGREYDSIYVDDFEKGNIVFLIPYGIGYMDKEFEELGKIYKEIIIDFFGDKFREDMIMEISENERQEQIKERQKLFTILNNWNEIMRMNKKEE